MRFSHEGAGLGLPWTGNILFSEWGEEEEREGHSRSTFLAFLAAAPSSCLELLPPGCWPSATLSRCGRRASHLGCPWDLDWSHSP